MLPGPAFVSPQGGAALRVSPHGGPGLQPLWRAAAVLPGGICASRAHATRRAGRSEATARPSLRMEPKRVGSRAKSDAEGHRTHRFRVPPSAWESHSLTTYRVFRTTSEKHRVSCHSASLRPAVLSTEHEGVLDGFRFRYEKRYGYDADAHARGRKPRWRPAIGASGSPRTGSYRRTCQGLRP